MATMIPISKMKTPSAHTYKPVPHAFKWYNEAMTERQRIFPRHVHLNCISIISADSLNKMIIFGLTLMDWALCVCGNDSK